MSGDVFGARVRAVVVFLAMTSLIAAVVAMVYGRKLTDPEARPRDSYSRGPLGHRALVETLGRLGVRVTRWHTGDLRNVSGPVFFVEPDAPADVARDEESLADVLEDRRAKGYVSVVVLPKWRLTFLGEGIAESTSTIDRVVDATGLPLVIARSGNATDRPRHVRVTSDAGGARNLRLPWPQTATGAPRELLHTDLGTLVACDEPRLVCVITDPDLLHNFNVQRAEHARVVHWLLTEVLDTASVVVDETFHGHRESRSLAEALGTFPAVLLLVHGLFVALCVLAMGRLRFGTPRAPSPALGRGPREAITVAADVLALGQPLARLSTRYVEHVVIDLHRRLGLPDEGDVQRRAMAIDTVAARRGLPPLAATTLRATYDLAGTPRPRPAELFALARRAHAHRLHLLGRPALTNHEAPR